MSKNKEKPVENLKDLLTRPKDIQLSIFKDFLELTSLYAQELFKEEVEKKAGEKYQRENRPEENKYDRWGSNPGSIRVGEEKIPIRVPRLLNREDNTKKEVDIYKQIKHLEAPEEHLLKKIILGLSQKDYEKVSKRIADSFGLSQSTISRRFKEQSKEILKEFENRDLGKYDFIALVLDGKYLKNEQVVIALGITMGGIKIPLGFIQTNTENSVAIKGLLKDLIRRNFRFEEGILAITDGSKGMIKAVREVFGSFVFMQRCQWHKRENVVSHLNKDQQKIFRRKLREAFSNPGYQEALKKLLLIVDELERINHSAANSLREGLEETLTLHKLGVAEELGEHLGTTNSIESVNSQIARYVRKVKRWKNGDMIARWISVSLVEIQPRLKKLYHYRKLPLLRKALIIALQTENKIAV
jgi:putative transposase